MSRRVVLVLPDLPHFEGPYTGSVAHGLASIAAVLRARGDRVRLLHYTRPPRREEFRHALLAEPADLIGFTAITPVLPLVRQWIAWAREAIDVPIIVGGVHAILNPEEVIAVPGVDLVCTGEGEEPMAEICGRLEAGAGLDGIAGTWIRDRRGVRRNPRRPLIPDLDSLPPPDYSIFSRERMFGAGEGTFSVMMSRGCPYRCSYCSNAALRAVYPNPRAFVRHRSPSAAVEEVARIVAAIPGIRQIIFNDNILYPSRAWLAEFSPLFGRRVGLPFTANTRPNLVDEETVRLLRRAGCIRVCMGVECGDEDIANRILLRGLDNRTIRRAFRLVREGGMETVSYNILGSPFETRRTMLATVRLNAELRPTRLAGFFYFPFPGTRSFQICAEHGFITRRAGLNVSERVNIVQPSVSEVDVLFVQRAFPRLVRLYMLVNRMPARAARGAEALLDAWLASPFLPRRFLLLLRDLRRFVRSGVRSLVARPPTRDRPATST